MSYAFTGDVPVGEDHYAEVRAAIGAAVPEGLVVHLAVRRGLVPLAARAVARCSAAVQGPSRKPILPGA